MERGSSETAEDSAAPDEEPTGDHMQELLMLEPLWAGTSTTTHHQHHHLHHLHHLPTIDDAEDLFADLTDVYDDNSSAALCSSVETGVESRDLTTPGDGQSSKDAGGSADSEQEDAGSDVENQNEMVMVPSGENFTLSLSSSDVSKSRQCRTSRN